MKNNQLLELEKKAIYKQKMFVCNKINYYVWTSIENNQLNGIELPKKDYNKLSCKEHISFETRNILQNRHLDNLIKKLFKKIKDSQERISFLTEINTLSLIDKINYIERFLND